METLQSKVIEMLEKECSCAGGVSIYMRHIILRTDGANSASCKELQEETRKPVSQNFPEREEILPFTMIGEGLKDIDFHVERKLKAKTS